MSEPTNASSSYTAPVLSLKEVRDTMQHLAGRLKTIIDAAISDPRQCKALKDLIHATVWSEHYEQVMLWVECQPTTPSGINEKHEPFPFYSDAPS